METEKNMTQPFDLALHDHLLGLGYSYRRRTSRFGQGRFDQYTGPDEEVYYGRGRASRLCWVGEWKSQG